MTENKNEKNSILYAIWDWVKTIAIALIITILIKLFILDATRVSGNSMETTLHNGDMLLVDKIGKNFRTFNRGDIVILNAPDYPNRLYVKRIIGIGGDKISIHDGSVYVNDKKVDENYTSISETIPTTEVDEWVLDDDHVFVMGDNRIPGESNDSRKFGPIRKDSLVGHAFVRFYPFDNMGLIDNDPYNLD